MKYIIKHRFVSLNAYLNAERSNKYIAAKIKKDETQVAYLSLLGKPKIDCEFPVRLRIIWHVKDNRIDADNKVWAKKFLMDGFVKAKIIPDDSMKYVNGFEDIIVIDKNEYVEIEVLE